MAEFSPRMAWPFPQENSDPWFERFESFVRSVDASGFAAREDRNTILTGGGTLTWNTATGLTWTEDFGVWSPSTSRFSRLVANTLLPANGQIIRAEITRAPGSNVNVAAEVASIMANTDNSYVLGLRFGDNFIFHNGSLIKDGTKIDAVNLFSGGVNNFSYHVIPPEGITVSLGQEMFVDQIITGSGILHVQGLVKSPPPGPTPFKLITPPQLVASVNDYGPVEFGPATNVNISAIAGPLSITGMQANPGVKSKTLTNSGPNPWQLPDSDALSSSAAQFLTPGAVPFVVGPGESIEIFRDPSVAKWRAAV